MIEELISRIFMWLMALFFAGGVYVCFPTPDHINPGTEVFLTLICLVGCVGAIIGSFHVYAPGSNDDRENNGP